MTKHERVYTKCSYLFRWIYHRLYIISTLCFSLDDFVFIRVRNGNYEITHFGASAFEFAKHLKYVSEQILEKVERIERVKTTAQQGTTAERQGETL